MSANLKNINKRITPQSERANSHQVKNNAGGYVYEISDLDRVRRFLILGVDGNTSYQSGNDLARENADVVLKVAKESPAELAEVISYVSKGGLAPKQDATMFALAAAFSVPEALPYMQSIFNDVVRTASHLFTFVSYVKQFRGWGSGLRKTVDSWYAVKALEPLGYQVTKYRNRAGYTHRDLLRLVHPKAFGQRDNLYAYMADKPHNYHNLPQSVKGYISVSTAQDISDVMKVLDEYNLSWEMIPTQFLNDVDLWKILLAKGVPMTALIRQLSRLTRIGVFEDKKMVKLVVSQLTDKERLTKARVHPMSILLALRTYQSGFSNRGTTRWSPVSAIVDALDEAFYLSFGNVTPANKRTMIALDVSGSMGITINGSSLITAREAAMAMSLITLSTEEDVTTVAFSGSYDSIGSDTVKPIDLSKRRRLDDMVNAVRNMDFGATDCAGPILYALENKLEIDTFVVYTDCETWEGEIHVDQALKMYRDKTGIDARMVVAGFTATSFTIGNPDDGNVLNIVGLDSSIGNLVSAFSRREF